jgi:hypothetical protein
MPTDATTSLNFAYRPAAEQALRVLKRDRDRQVLVRRFGLGAAVDTLEAIGRDYGISRERVRQIEATSLRRIREAQPTRVMEFNHLAGEILAPAGGVLPASRLVERFNLAAPEDAAYIILLAAAAPDLSIILDHIRMRTTVSLTEKFDVTALNDIAAELAATLRRLGRTHTSRELARYLTRRVTPVAVEQIAAASKELASFNGRWGLATWPEVNPRSVRDRAYLTLAAHGQPLHFAELTAHIARVIPGPRPAKVQAVHNELIKDPRFILVGRGIYALADWGYTPGTVADIIKEVLRQESPLHRDEIIRRVLLKRQVKESTIMLNLQEQREIERVTSLVYRLRSA